MASVEKNVPTREYHVVGLTHIDLAWLFTSDHYRLCQENVAVRLLDILEKDSEFTYAIEQIMHYRWLHENRPDLIERLRPFVEEGRVEVVGGMASSLDTNGPNGECYVRNHLIGRAWAREHLGADVKVGSLIDTFGISAQTPQIHRQLGMNYLFANRLGGNVFEPFFYSRGIDGSTILMAGRDNHTPGKRDGRVHFRFLSKRTDCCDELFDYADNVQLPGPHLLIPYDECETPPTYRSRYQIDTRNSGDPSRTFRYSTMLEFFTAAEEEGLSLKTIDGDLSPVLTGCYGLRPFVRLRNRQIETLVLEAEKWGALTGRSTAPNVLEEAWWNLSYIQSHDVYSGSFPHGEVRDEVIAYLDQTEDMAEKVLEQSLGSAAIEADQDIAKMCVYNGLPWLRQDVVRVPLPEGWEGVTEATCGDENAAFTVRDGMVQVTVNVPATGMSNLVLTRGADKQEVDKPVADAVLENEHLRVQCSAANGIEKIINKATGNIVAEDCGGLITVQNDIGYFQREQPYGGEVPAAVGDMRLLQRADGSLLLSGEYGDLPWARPDNHLRWELALQLLPGKARLDVGVKIDWKGEDSRVRLRLPTTLDTGSGIYEIPFGTVKRQPYGVRSAAHNDWPVHRFTAVEDGSEGVALINTGAIGGETLGGTIWSILFRAPARDWNLLRCDETSSQHGIHEFQFAIVAYQVEIADSPVFEMAQEINNPLLARGAAPVGVKAGDSLLSLSPSSCILSAVKAPEDGSNEIIVRFYESGGRDDTAVLTIPGLTRALTSDLLETQGEELTVEDDTVRVPVRPYEIKTLRVMRG